MRKPVDPIGETVQGLVSPLFSSSFPYAVALILLFGPVILAGILMIIAIDKMERWWRGPDAD